MRKNLFLLLLSIPISSLWACQGPEPSHQHQQETKVVSVDSIDTSIPHGYNTIKYSDFSPYFSQHEHGLDSTKFMASFPIFENDAINDLIKDDILTSGEDKIEQVAEQFMQGFNEYAEEVLASNSQVLHSWYLHQSTQVILNTGRYLSISTEINDYLGGAHGAENIFFSNYDLSEKKTLRWSDLVADSLKFSIIAEEIFRRQEKLSPQGDFGQGYFFEGNTFQLADNFALLPQGILFHYNPYEIKPYSEGYTLLLIPYQRIKDILKPAGHQLLTAIEQVNEPSN